MSRLTGVCFRDFPPRHRRFPSRIINFQLLKLVSRYALTLMAVNLSLSTQRSSSPLPTQWSSSTHPAGGQTLPSPPSCHSLPLLATNLTPNHPAVLFHPFWRPTSPLPPAGDERRVMGDRRRDICRVWGMG